MITRHKIICRLLSQIAQNFRLELRQGNKLAVAAHDARSSLPSDFGQVTRNQFLPGFILYNGELSFGEPHYTVPVGDSFLCGEEKKYILLWSNRRRSGISHRNRNPAICVRAAGKH